MIQFAEGTEPVDDCSATFDAWFATVSAATGIPEAVLRMEPDESVTSGRAIPEPVTSRGATADTAPGLCASGMDGERLGRLAWVPGA